MSKSTSLQSAPLLAIAVACGLLLAGCAVGPDYQRPATPAPATLTRSDLGLASTGSAHVDARWWQALGSAQLDALIQEALDHSPTIEAAEATLRAAHQNVIAQRGYFFPSVAAGYNPTRQNTGQTMSPALDSGQRIYTYHTAQLSVSYAPDLFGGNRRQVEGLVATEQEQRLQLQAARLSLAANLAGAVIQSAMLQEQARLTREAIDAAEQQLAHMRKLQANGYASGLDVATQQTLLLQLQQSLPPLLKSLEQTRNLTATLLARTPDAAPPVPALSSFTLPALPEAVASRLVEQRPDIRVAETQVQQASAAVGVATAARLPQLSLTAAYGGGATTLGRMFSSGNIIWSLGAGLLQPLFDGGTLKARQGAAQEQLHASAAQYQATVLSAFQDVANALYAVDADRQALRMSEQSAQASGDTYRLTHSQFSQGYAGKPALLAAEQSRLQAEAAVVAARGSLLGDTIAVYQALGGGVLEDGAATQARAD